MTTDRDQMLARVRAGLARNRAMLEAEAAAAPHAPPPFVHPPAADLVAQFAAELTKLEGRVYRCADAETALETIGAILRDTGATSVIVWERDQIGLAGLEALLSTQGVAVLDSQVGAGDERKARLQTLEPALVCISGADCGIAESGSLLLLHGPGRPRLASLLAPLHIAVLRADQLVRGLGEALAQLRERYGAGMFDATSNLTLITGPSRTADIEMTLTLGIHGPKEIHVVVVEG